MRLPPNCLKIVLFLALMSLGLERLALASPPIPATSQGKSAGPTAPVTTPDYGGRENVVSTVVASSGSQTMNPLSQAGRAFEALVIVLALVAGGLFLLKRSGWLKSDGTISAAVQRAKRLPHSRGLTAPKSALTADVSTDLITVVSSQTLPGGFGSGLHLVTVGEKTLLLAETAQSVTLITELDTASPPQSAPETPQERTAFAKYLAEAGITPEPAPQVRAVENALSATSDRLQSLLTRGQEETTCL